MILSGFEILQCLKAGFLKIEPFRKENLGPCSYDLTTGRIVTDYGEIRSGIISPGMAAGLTTEETIELPCRARVAGLVSMRSGPSRKAILASFSHLVDPGYAGKLNFVVWPLKPMTLSVGDSLFQILFVTTGEVIKPWTGESKGFGERL